MHPKYWKFPGGAMYREQAADDQGAGGAGGSGGEASDAEKAAAAAAAAAEAERKSGEDQGGKQPTDAEAKLIKEVMQKKEALRAAEAEAAAAKTRLAEFDGIDAAEVRALLADKKAAEENALAAKGDFETLKTRMAEEHTKVTKTLQEQIAALQAAVSTKDGTIEELSIGQQFSQSKFISDELTLTPSKARTIYGAHFDTVDGSVVAFDKPRGAAGRAPLVDQTGTNFGFEDALRKLVEADPDRESLLRSKVKPGAGSESKQKAPPQGGRALSGVSRIEAGLSAIKLLGQ